jgi:hypothetical protein
VKQPQLNAGSLDRLKIFRVAGDQRHADPDRNRCDQAICQFEN